MQEKERLIDRQLHYSAISLVDGHISLGQGYDRLEEVVRIYHFMQEFVDKSRTVYLRGRDAALQGFAKKNRESMGSLIRICAASDFAAMFDYFCMHRMNPRIELFARQFDYGGIEACHVRENDAKTIGKLTDELLREVTSMRFFRRLDNYEKSVNGNIESVRGHLHQLYDRFDRLTVVRLACGYNEEFLDSLGNANLYPAYVKKQINALIGYVSKKWKKAGYIWKIDFRRETSYRIHWFLFFDGDESISDIEVGDVVGRLWAVEATNGKGLFWNFNAHIEKFKSPERLGYGEIDTSDAKRRACFEEGILDLFAIDRYVKVAIPKFGKTYSHTDRFK